MIVTDIGSAIFVAANAIDDLTFALAGGWDICPTITTMVHSTRLLPLAGRGPTDRPQFSLS